MISFLLIIFSIKVYAQTPNFEYLQKYLDPSPVGIGAKEAWKLPGGRGENVHIIDIESGLSNYDDLSAPFILKSKSTSDHGAAVMGVLVSKDDGIGTTGIVNKAKWGFISNYFHGVYINSYDSVEDKHKSYANSYALTLDLALQNLSAGDVLIIEGQVPGPLNKFAPMEYWPKVFSALKKITRKGIHCVAAAGNGGHSLDDNAYKNVFNLRYKDSGCIIVGAVTLEPTNDRRGHQKVRSSNFGSRIDVHGYGKNVATIGFGDLFDDGKNSKYTRFFSGTSSATAIVAGAVASVSSIALAKGRKISPRKMRYALRRTGTAAYDQEYKNLIGKLPDIKALLKYLRLIK